MRSLCFSSLGGIVARSEHLVGTCRRRVSTLSICSASRFSPRSVRYTYHHYQYALQIPSNRIARAKSSSENVQAKRKPTSVKLSRFCSPEELRKQTDTLLSFLETATPLSPSKETDVTFHHGIFHDALIGWMQMAHQGHGLAAVEQARKLVHAMEGSIVPATVVDYAILLKSYAASKGGKAAAEQAEELLERIISRCREYAQLSERNRPKIMPPPEPSQEMFNQVMDCWAKSRCADAGLRAEEVAAMMEAWNNECQSMLAKDESHPYSGCLANVVSMNAIVDAWSKSGERHGPERVHDMLNQAIDEKRELDAYAFSAAINAWVQSGRGRRGVMKAEEIMNKMVSLNRTGHYAGKVAPNTRSFAIIINGWAKCEDIERTCDAACRAEATLFTMIGLHKKSLSAKPNAYCFNSYVRMMM